MPSGSVTATISDDEDDLDALSQDASDDCGLFHEDDRILHEADDFTMDDEDSTSDADEFEPFEALRLPADDSHSSENVKFCFSSYEDASIFPGSQITKGQLRILTMAFTLKHHITGMALKDLLALFDAIMPGALPASSYLFCKFLYDNTANQKTMFYCPQCGVLVGSLVPERCTMCNAFLSEKQMRKEGNYFITVSLIEQLKEMLESRNMLEYANERHVDAACEAVREFVCCRDNLTLACNIDGVPVFKSSNVSIWPIFVTVNELSIDKRRQFVLLHSLWFGNTKPAMNMYLKPFVEELKCLRIDGVKWKDGAGCERVTRSALTLCVCDSVARPLVQNFKQFNGSHGCSFCLHEGTMVKKGRGSVRVYPAQDPMPQMRTCTATLQHAELALANKKPHFGVKGPSILAELMPQFDIINGYSPDWMHSVCLGVVRQVVDLCLDTSNHAKPFYMGNKVDDLDNILLLQHPPSELARAPRSLKQRRFWKASEWRSFLLFYSFVTFAHVMPNNYFHHFLLLVFGIHLLLQECPTEEALEHARLCFIKFVVQFPKLYGEQSVSFNVHLLLHLCSCARLHGNLQKTSAFIFEDACGGLLKAFHGTTGVQWQMVRNFFAQRNLNSLQTISAHAFDGCDISATFMQMCTRLRRLQKARTVGNDCTVFGVSKNRLCTNKDKKAIAKLLDINSMDQYTVEIFERFCIRQHLYTSGNYADLCKRDNSVVCTGRNKYGRIMYCAILSLKCDPAVVEPVILLQDMKTDPSFRKLKDGYVGCDINSFMAGVITSNEVIACRPTEIQCKCVVLTNGNNTFVVQLPKFECD